MTQRLGIIIYSICILFFGCFFLWPIWQVLQGGFIDPSGHITIAYFREVFVNPIYIEGLTNSFLLATCSTLLTIVIALPLAIIAHRYEFFGKPILMAMILLPIMLPPFVGAIGITQMLNEYGVINAILRSIGLGHLAINWLSQGRFFGIVLLNALSLYPILYMNILSSLANIDPSLDEAAENLGCRGWRRFLHITLPLMRPGLFAGCTIVFIWTFTELGVPLMFEYSRVTPVQIFNGLKDIGDSPFPYALVATMLVLSVMCYALGKGLFGRNTFAMMAKANHTPETKRLSWIAQACCFGLFAGITWLALLPHLSVILYSFASDWYNTILPSRFILDNYTIALGHPLTVSSIQNSLFYASGATMINIVLGIAIAFVTIRTRLPGRHLLDTLAMLPLAVPGIVLAFGYFAMTLEGKLFDFLNPIQNPTMLLIIAYAMRKMPFIVRAAVAGLQQTSETYEEAAQNLGCPPFKAICKITIPLIAANLLAGGILAFSFAMLEVSDSLLLAQKQTFYPITKAIYELMNLIGDGPFLACALGVWAMAFLAVTITGASMLMGQKLGSIFRA